MRTADNKVTTPNVHLRMTVSLLYFVGPGPALLRNLRVNEFRRLCLALEVIGLVDDEAVSVEAVCICDGARVEVRASDVHILAGRQHELVTVPGGLSFRIAGAAERADALLGTVKFVEERNTAVEN